jgi:hypothetical protein
MSWWCLWKKKKSFKEYGCFGIVTGTLPASTEPFKSILKKRYLIFIGKSLLKNEFIYQIINVFYNYCLHGLMWQIFVFSGFYIVMSSMFKVVMDRWGKECSLYEHREMTLKDQRTLKTSLLQKRVWVHIIVTCHISIFAQVV